MKDNSAENSVLTKLERNAQELNGDLRAKLNFEEDVAESKITVKCSTGNYIYCLKIKIVLLSHNIYATMCHEKSYEEIVYFLI